MIGEIIGQEISVNVSKNMKAQVIPQGNSYQATREGYNLLNKSKVSLFNENKYIQGTVDLKSNTNYTIYFNKIPTDVSWKFEDESTVSLTSVNSNIKTFESGTHTSLSFYFGQDIAYSTLEEYLSAIQLMLLEGTYTSENLPAYEEYGAMPSLNYPSEVEAVGDNINLFNDELEVGAITGGSGDNIDDTTRIRTKNFIELEAGTYTLSFKGVEQCGGFLYDLDETFKETLFTWQQEPYTFTIVTKSKLKFTFKNENNNSITPENINEIKLEKGTTATAYSPYGQGNIEIIHNNKNFLNFPDRNVTQNGVTIQITNGNHFKITGTQTGIVNYELFSSDYFENINNIAYNKYPVTISRNTTGYLDIELNFASGTNNWYMQIAKNTTKVIKNILNEKINRLSLYISFSSTKEINYEFDLQLEISKEVTDIIEPKENTYILPIQKPFYKIGDYVDNFIKQNNKWYEQHYIKELILTGEEEWSQSLLNSFPTFLLTIRTNMIKGKDGLCNYFKIYNSVWQLDLEGIEFYDIYLNDFKFRINLGSNSEITTLEAWKAKVQELYNAGTPIKVYYVLATPELIECTEEQTQILEQLNNLYLYEGINYLYSTDDLSPIFQFSYDKIVNDFKFYLSENGRLIFPKENISFLCSISESTIPVMPEALETSAIIAGRDGDVPLETTYGPMSFELVLYTEDNLTPDEKLQQEQFLTKFCNSIKNNTETFALELAQKFYKIKYNGVLDRENYPKYLRVVFPFKSSNSYAYDVKNNTIYGNNKFESKTIESCGFKCIIKGPALKPILSLNDYSIEYTNTILDGESLIIDTNNSTAILVSSDGTETNAMRYYNHQFPKILNGENELKILSGIDNPENVSISWYDLTL